MKKANETYVIFSNKKMNCNRIHTNDICGYQVELMSEWNMDNNIMEHPFCYEVDIRGKQILPDHYNTIKVIKRIEFMNYLNDFE